VKSARDESKKTPEYYGQIFLFRQGAHADRQRQIDYLFQAQLKLGGVVEKYILKHSSKKLN